jgi:hypothetical protein
MMRSMVPHGVHAHRLPPDRSAAAEAPAGLPGQASQVFPALVSALGLCPRSRRGWRRRRHPYHLLLVWIPIDRVAFHEHP